jgi:two-component sensor histidine kinase
VAGRVAGGELGMLGRAFDEMAKRLEQDVVELRQSEGAIRKALSEKETLIQELYHRTKNNLQIVRSLMNLQASDSDSVETCAIVREMDNRIQGLALVHEMLYQSGDLSNLDLTQYLGSLARLVARNFWGHHPAVSVDVTGDPRHRHPLRPGAQ